MSPEPLPWDRRDFRKHERSGADSRFSGGGFGGGGPHRWREQQHHPHAPPPFYHHHNYQQQQQQPWYSDFRSSRPIPPGHGKQGGWHMYPDEAGHVFLPFGSRYSDRNLEDDNFRPFGSRGDARYLGNNRENRGSFGQKDWRSPSWEPAALSGGPGRPTSEVNNQKTVDNAQTCHNTNNLSYESAHSLPDSLPGQFQPLLDEKNGITADVLASSGQKSEKENGLGSIDWKPMKWARSGSLSSRGAGFSHSSSSKSLGVDSTEILAEVQLKNGMPVESPATACVMSGAPVPSDETSSRKKPRLGWGEGLAKYEKKKIECPEDDTTKGRLVVNVTNTETMQSPSLNLFDKSPRVASLSDCASPATPSSVACSSSPGINDKDSIKSANVDQDTANLSCSTSIMSQAHHDGPAFNLENLELTSISNLSSLINDLLQYYDPISVETGYARTTLMNKLLIWKVNILKALEVTESEIDSLETELRSLIVEPKGCCPCPAASSSQPGDGSLKPCEDQVVAAGCTVAPSSLQIVSSRNMIDEHLSAALKEEHMDVKDEIDSPGTATSKLVEVLPSGEDTFTSRTVECVEGFVKLELENANNSNQICLENGLSNEDDACHVDVPKPIVSNCQNLASVGFVNCDIDHIYDSILTSNKDSASMAAEELSKLLPDERCVFDISTASRASSFQQDTLVVKEKFLARKLSLKFKEKVIMLKLKIFQHFWKEGRGVSIKKLRGKSHKMFDLSRNGHRRNRSSSRSRISYFAGPSRTVSAEEVVEFVRWLLSESPFKPCRKTLKMPALILGKEIKMSRFISDNGLVEDPCAAEKERSIINTWTAEEGEIFIDKLAIFGKNFGMIASFLEHKTIADCIEFYYKNHKSECFERARKKPEFSKQGKSQSTTYLVAMGKRRNCEVNAANLDILGEASIIASNVNDGSETQLKCMPRIFSGASSSHKMSRVDHDPLQRSNSLDMYASETAAADVLAGICGSLSSEAMSSCITSSFDPADGYQDWKCARVSSSIKWPLTPDVTQNVDEQSDESCGEMDSTDWTDDEKSFFIRAVSSYGKDFVMISQFVGTKSKEQCKIFFSKARKCLGLDQIHPRAGIGDSGDVNGGGSDIEDGCLVQNGSVICNDNSNCRMVDLSPHETKVCHASGTAGTLNFKPDVKICEDTGRACPLDSVAAKPALINSSMDDTPVNDKPAIDFNVDGIEQNVENGACGSELDVRTLDVSSNNTDHLQVEMGDNCGMASSSSEADNKALAVVSDGCHWEENEGEGLLLPEEHLDSKKLEDQDANSNDETFLCCKVSKRQLTGAVSHPSADAYFSMLDEPGHQEADLKIRSAEKPQIISSQQNSEFAYRESSALFSVPVKYQKYSGGSVPSIIGADGIGETNSQKTSKTDDHQQHFSDYSLSETVDSSQILKGYPVSVHSIKEMNEDVNCKKHVLLKNVSNREGALHSDQHSNFTLQKCTSSRHQTEVVQLAFPFQENSCRDSSRPQSSCLSDLDKPSRNGDVKLFGKVLVSSQQKPNSCMQDVGDNNTQNHKVGGHSLNLKLSDKKGNLDSSISKFDHNKYPGTENIPVGSFGFWDGSRVRMGFPLPDSALLLTKYPAAFSNHSTMKLEQSPLVGVAKSNDHSFNGVSVFPSRELNSSNGLAEWQVLKNCELKPFAMDMKQQQDILFSEMQRRNGFDVMTGKQQQSRGMVGVNVVGRGEVLRGDQCSGVSDPVTAIKMHYARAQNFSVQAGTVLGEDEKWRSNGDVGR